MRLWSRQRERKRKKKLVGFFFFAKRGRLVAMLPFLQPGSCDPQGGRAASFGVCFSDAREGSARAMDLPHFDLLKKRGERGHGILDL